jgi:hypothetical protein
MANCPKETHHAFGRIWYAAHARSPISVRYLPNPVQEIGTKQRQIAIVGIHLVMNAAQDGRSFLEQLLELMACIRQMIIDVAPLV